MKKKIEVGCRLDELEEQLGIHGSYNDKPCCGRCGGTGLKVMELSKDKKKHICPRCGNMVRAEDFKRWCERPEFKELKK